MTRSVVVRAPNWIGDFLMALPALTALRRLHPGARLALQVHPRLRSLAERVEGIDVYHEVPGVAAIRAARYDVGVLFAPSLSSALVFAAAGVKERVGWPGGGRSLFLTRRVPRPDRTLHQSRHFLGLVEALGWNGGLPPLAFTPSPDDASAAEAWLAEPEPSGAPLYALAPAVAYGPAKTWPAERFRDLALRLSGDGGRVVVAGAAADRETLHAVARDVPRARVLAGDLPLPAVAALLARCRAFAGNDSGLLHLARAVGTPVVGVYGSTNPRWTGPEPRDGRVVALGLDCSPCYRRECPLPGAPRSCLTGIEVDTVERAVREVAR